MNSLKVISSLMAIAVSGFDLANVGHLPLSERVNGIRGEDELMFAASEVKLSAII